jgi:hypothetical protein
MESKGHRGRDQEDLSLAGTNKFRESREWACSRGRSQDKQCL